MHLIQNAKLQQIQFKTKFSVHKVPTCVEQALVVTMKKTPGLYLA